MRVQINFQSLRKPSYIPSNPIEFFFSLSPDLPIPELYQFRNTTALVRKFSVQKRAGGGGGDKYLLWISPRPHLVMPFHLFPACHLSPFFLRRFFHPLLFSSVTFFRDCPFPFSLRHCLLFPPELFHPARFFIRSLFLLSLLSSLMSPLN